MLAFLLDAHLPLAVVKAVRASRPACPIEHLARWRGGALRAAPDEDVLDAARTAGLVLVTFDMSTILDIVHYRLLQSLPVPAVAVIPSRRIAQNDVGNIARALVPFHDDPSTLDPAYPIVYLRPASL